MYLPFIRGRKFDLEAIEALTFRASVYSSDNIIPIIEPVSLKRDCLKSYLTLANRFVPFILIVNPQSGELTEGIVESHLINGTLQYYDGYYLGYIIHQQTTVNDLKVFFDKYGDRKISLIHYSLPANTDAVVAFLNNQTNVAHNIFLTQLIHKIYIDKLTCQNSKRIIVEDGFNKMLANSEYAINTTEYFGNLHNEYKTNNYDGFGDFCTIGEKYSEGGGRAKAVVIHWTFLHEEEKHLMIKHFVSDDMEDSTNLGGKFGEAYDKLSSFVSQYNTSTPTLGNYFISSYGDEGKFPSLGAIKKFSIMHHIELIRSTLL